MKRILLLGAPGAGKGTQAQGITKLFGIPQISTGDLLRAEIASGSEFGKELEATMAAGNLVADSVVAKLVKERVAKEDCKEGFLLDGFPRNLAQAKIYEEAGLDLDLVIEFVVPEELIVERITGRRTHPASGRTYHVKYNPPKVEGKDDVTGEDLVIRKDDNEAAVKQRLAVFHEQTTPLVDYYKGLSRTGKLNYLRIIGEGDVEEIAQNLRDELRLIFN